MWVFEDERDCDHTWKVIQYLETVNPFSDHKQNLKSIANELFAVSSVNVHKAEKEGRRRRINPRLRVQKSWPMCSNDFEKSRNWSSKYCWSSSYFPRTIYCRSCSWFRSGKLRKAVGFQHASTIPIWCKRSSKKSRQARTHQGYYSILFIWSKIV